MTNVTPYNLRWVLQMMNYIFLSLGLDFSVNYVSRNKWNIPWGGCVQQKLSLLAVSFEREKKDDFLLPALHRIKFDLDKTRLINLLLSSLK